MSFYVLKTHNDKPNMFWGMVAIGHFPTKKKAREFCNNQMATSDSNIKLVIVKALALFKVTEIKFKESKLC